ncbi:MAG TPA: hypothetical protein VGD40_07545 [Chryseosolibacter sp.]
MKISSDLRQRGNKVSFLLVLTVLVLSQASVAQTATPVFARVIAQKVPAGKEQEFEKFMNDVMKPVHQLRKQKGKIINWYFFKVHFTGANDAYNYVAVHYYNSWSNTEDKEQWGELMKEANPKADVAAQSAKMRELRTVVSNQLYYRQAAIDPKTPANFKYVTIDFMKVKPGMASEYMKVEDEWKPFHQHLADNGKAGGWGLWSVIFPGGSSGSHDFVTSSRYSNYAQLGELDYAATMKAVYPSKDLQTIFDHAEKSRDLVRSELWELIAGLQ